MRMVSLALLDLPKSWHSYQDSVNGREKLPGWERLWSDLVQEEIRRRTRDSSSSMHDEENCALESKVKKGKEKVSLFESCSSSDGKKVDKSKVRCFRCHEIGSWVRNLYALEVQDACKALSSEATDGDLVVERERILPLNMQSQKKSQTIVEEPRLVQQLQEVLEEPQ